MPKLLMFLITSLTLSCQTTQPAMGSPSGSDGNTKSIRDQNPLLFERIIGQQDKTAAVKICRIFANEKDKDIDALVALWDEVKKSDLTTGVHIMPRIPSVEYYAWDKTSKHVLLYDHEVIRQRQSQKAPVLVQKINLKCDQIN